MKTLNIDVPKNELKDYKLSIVLNTDDKLNEPKIYMTTPKINNFMNVFSKMLTQEPKEEIKEEEIKEEIKEEKVLDKLIDEKKKDEEIEERKKMK